MSVDIKNIEEKVLGILIQNSQHILDVSETLKENDFYVEINKKVYSTMISLFNEKGNFDAIILEAELSRLNLLESFGGKEKIIQLLEEAPLDINIDLYINILKENSSKRNILIACKDIENEANRNYKSYLDLKDYAQMRIFEVTQSETRSDVSMLGEIGSRIKKKIIELSNGTIISNNDMPTSYIQYDKITGGLQRTDLIILAARPAMGKTAFALNIAYNIAKLGKTVLVFSLEMGTEQLYNRLLAASSKIEMNKIKNLNYTQSEQEILNRTMKELSELKMYVSEASGVTILDIKNISRKIKAQNELDFIVIDYLQLISSYQGDNRSREQQVSEISRSLKILAKELNVPILALSQLSRGVEGRQDKRPMLSDLRESGAIEQDADQVLFLYREGYYTKESNKEQEEQKEQNDIPLLQRVELIISKHRNGSTGTVQLGVDLDKQLFFNPRNMIKQ